jgi:hypothetical protein
MDLAEARRRIRLYLDELVHHGRRLTENLDFQRGESLSPSATPAKS